MKGSTVNNYSGITGTHQDRPGQTGTTVILIISDYLVYLGNYFFYRDSLFFLMCLNLSLLISGVSFLRNRLRTDLLKCSLKANNTVHR